MYMYIFVHFTSLEICTLFSIQLELLKNLVLGKSFYSILVSYIYNYEVSDHCSNQMFDIVYH